MATGDFVIHIEPLNCILVFQDETGREWLAGATMLSPVRYEDGQIVERLPMEQMKDRVFVLTDLKLVDHA
jgi:hypothetical protein